MNNEFLRVNAKEEQEGINTGTFEVKTESVAEDKGKVTLLSILGIHKKGVTLSDELKVPDIRNAFPALLTTVLLNLILFFLAQATTNSFLLILMTFASAMILPLFVLYFIYELNQMKNVSYIQILGGFVLGFLFFILLDLVKGNLYAIFYEETWALWFLRCIVEDVGVFFIAMLYVKLAKKDNIFAIILLVVSVYSGFCAARSISEQISALLVTITVGGAESTSHLLYGIIFSETYLGKCSSAFFTAVVYNSVFLSLFSFFQSVICGGIIALTYSPVRSDRAKESSVYLLLLLSCILHLMIEFNSTIEFFSVFLKTVAFVIAFVVFLRMFNYLLSRTNFVK